MLGNHDNSIHYVRQPVRIRGRRVDGFPRRIQKVSPVGLLGAGLLAESLMSPGEADPHPLKAGTHTLFTLHRIPKHRED